MEAGPMGHHIQGCQRQRTRRIHTWKVLSTMEHRIDRYWSLGVFSGLLGMPGILNAHPCCGLRACLSQGCACLAAQAFLNSSLLLNTPQVAAPKLRLEQGPAGPRPDGPKPSQPEGKKYLL